MRGLRLSTYFEIPQINTSFRQFDLKGNLEPGESLKDRAVAVYESGRLPYIEWQPSVGRQREWLTGIKKDASLTLDGTGLPL